MERKLETMMSMKTVLGGSSKALLLRWSYEGVRYGVQMYEVVVEEER